MENQAPQGSESPENSPYKKRHSSAHESGGGEGEPWLVSYADMMTLLFGFFVVMYSLEASKKENLSETAMESARKALAEYFGGTYANPLGEVEKYINSSIGFASKRRSNDIQVRSIPEGMKIVMRSQILFDVGKAELNEEAKKLLTRLAVVIKSTNVAGLIRVEGHTDDSPISTPVFPSNWELSSARATSVVRIFESIGFPSSKLTAVGYGSSRPEASNRDESGFPLAENQALNRRVVINIVNSLDSRDQDKVPSETPVKKF